MAYIYINNATEKGYKFANVEVEKISSLLVDKYCTQKLCKARVTKLIKNLCPFPDQASSKAIPCRLHIHI